MPLQGTLQGWEGEGEGGENGRGEWRGDRRCEREREQERVEEGEKNSTLPYQVRCRLGSIITSFRPSLTRFSPVSVSHTHTFPSTEEAIPRPPLGERSMSQSWGRGAAEDSSPTTSTIRCVHT